MLQARGGFDDGAKIGAGNSAAFRVRQNYIGRIAAKNFKRILSARDADDMITIRLEKIAQDGSHQRIGADSEDANLIGER